EYRPSVESNVAQLNQLCHRALDWSSTHACQFDVKKFQLLFFINSERKYVPLSLTINGVTIAPSETAEYLGIIIDRRLKWRHQVEAAIAKGTSTIHAISRLTRRTYGMLHRYMCQLYSAVVLPKVEYGLAVQYEPAREKTGRKRLKGSVGIAKRYSAW
ncbi:hypothetical protein B0H10DRAFT_2349176, partial [Mycena sp. CBHHK59/15]